MVAITLPDGSQRQFDRPVTGLDVARDIGPGLAKSALAIRIDGEMRDLTTVIDSDCKLSIVTARDADALDLLRHDCAHLMAEAVKELYPEAQVTIGPSIENGFYYDFARATPFTPDDLTKIEAKMHEIVARNEGITREEWDRDQAVAFFLEQGEKYKAELIAAIPAGQVISLYRQGAFIDLCRGPHLPATGKIGKAFKLMKVAGAYWRGDARNEMLQRIYGTAWFDEKELKAYLTMLEEAEKRDHRRLGREMGLFHFQDEAPGSIFWHPKGWSLFQRLINYMRVRQDDAGYVEVNTPDVMDRALWETSGHWFNYRQNMFTTKTEDDRIFALKPMNCPGAVSLFAQGIKSYRDLPLRMAEFGKVHRYEPSGALHGLLRVRHFTQDDAHIFCTEEQMEEECKTVVALILDIYKDFGFDKIRIKLSTRPENRIGSDEIWDKLEGALSTALDHMGMEYELFPGEGAFYGPKLEFVLRDAIGRDWQCGTLQVDMNLPERFDIHYVAPDGSHKRPVMLHRALFGSLERFTGILTEHYAGKYPLWLAPVQVVVATVTSDGNDWASDVAARLKKAGIRVETDLRNEKITLKVREHSLQRVPYMLVIGKREAAEQTVAVRLLGLAGDSKQPDTIQAQSLEQVLERLNSAIAGRSRH